MAQRLCACAHNYSSHELRGPEHIPGACEQHLCDCENFQAITVTRRPEPAWRDNMRDYLYPEPAPVE